MYNKLYIFVRSKNNGYMIQRTIEQSIVLNYQDVKNKLSFWIKNNDKFTKRDLMARLNITQGTFYTKLKNNAWTDTEVLIILETIQ